MAVETARHPGGRPTKLTPRLQAKLVREIRAGHYLETACKLTGIASETLRRWLVDGASAPDGPYRELYGAVVKAEAEAEGSSLRTWRRSKDWKAHKEFLARRYRKRWGEDPQPEGGQRVVPVSILFRYRHEGYDPGAEPGPDGGAVEVGVQVGSGGGGAVPPPAGRASVQGLVEVDWVPPGMEPSPFTRFVTQEL